MIMQADVKNTGKMLATANKWLDNPVLSVDKIGCSNNQQRYAQAAHRQQSCYQHLFV